MRSLFFRLITNWFTKINQLLQNPNHFEAISAEPKSSHLRNQLANHYFSQNRLHEAEFAYKAAINLDKANSIAHYDYAFMRHHQFYWSLAKNDSTNYYTYATESKLHYSHVLLLSENDIETHYQLSLLYLTMLETTFDGLQYITGNIWDKKQYKRQPGRGAEFTIQQKVSQAEIDYINGKETTTHEIYSLTYYFSTNNTKYNRNNDINIAATQNHTHTHTTKSSTAKYVIPQRRTNILSKEQHLSNDAKGNTWTKNDNSTSIPSIETPFMASTKPISVDALNNAILRNISGTTLISSHSNHKKSINQSGDIILSCNGKKLAAAKNASIILKNDNITSINTISYAIPVPTKSTFAIPNIILSNDVENLIETQNTSITNGKTLTDNKNAPIIYQNDIIIPTSIPRNHSPLIPSIKSIPMSFIKETLTANDYVLNGKHNKKSNGLLFSILQLISMDCVNIIQLMESVKIIKSVNCYCIIISVFQTVYNFLCVLFLINVLHLFL